MSPRDDVADVLARYVWGFCRADFELLSGCFTSDATVLFPNGPRRGIDPVMAELRARRSGWDGEWIYTGNILVLAADEREIAAHTSNAVVGLIGAVHVYTSVGWYEDRFRFDAGSWRIERRKVFLGSPVKPG